MRRVYVLAVLLPLAFAPIAKSQDTKPQDPKKDPDQIGNRDVSRGVNFYSIEKEMALGKAMSEQVERQAKLLDDKVITEYVNRLGQNLARNSDTKIPLTIKVIDSKELNAVTLPGGYIYVDTGLIRMAQSEAELAAALAHEIAHVAARHGTRQATQTEIAQVATIPLIFLGGVSGICWRTAGAAGVVPIGLLAAQRSFEAEADTLGLQYLYKSGYDPLGMVDIFEKLFSFDERKHGRIAQVFSDHPVYGLRLVNVQKNIETMLKEKPEYVLNTSEFDDIKARLAFLDWNPKPEPPPDRERPTLKRKGDQLIASKKLVPEPNARASQIKEAYTVK
ncbi:MAG TPA: M48 family metalloprotease [Bryobacteraceae bacterium]|jgi:predicted Zn-dependent protease|nr:M48 family metalloprotease [Bryobacteraceae bacterium]